MGLSLMWDGTDIFWRENNSDDWAPLHPSSDTPELAAAFDAAAPDGMVGCAPPMLTALPEPGTLQIWSGLIVRTLPGWHSLVRGPANLPGPGGIAMYEGIVETDRWFGPMFTNLRFTRTNIPVTLNPDYPLIQLQPIQASAYRDAILDSTEFVPGMEAMSEADWLDYHRTIILPNQDPDRPFGDYAKQARRRRSDARAVCPMLNG
jgi:hypothetical protein